MNLIKHITDELHAQGHPNPSLWARRIEFGLSDKDPEYQMMSVANHLKRVLALSPTSSMDVRSLINPTLPNDLFLRNLNEHVIPFMVENNI